MCWMEFSHNFIICIWSLTLETCEKQLQLLCEFNIPVSKCQRSGTLSVPFFLEGHTNDCQTSLQTCYFVLPWSLECFKDIFFKTCHSFCFNDRLLIDFAQTTSKMLLPYRDETERRGGGVSRVWDAFQVCLLIVVGGYVRVVPATMILLYGGVGDYMCRVNLGLQHMDGNDWGCIWHALGSWEEKKWVKETTERIIQT